MQVLVKLIIHELDKPLKASDKLSLRVDRDEHTGGHHLPILEREALVSVLEELCDTLTDSTEGE